ncbi:ABC transporter ATP-binding protein [Nodosilinea sp. LEGE 07088]|uniref:ABC transporter ATP-binding protein n=1 Tax=Nodosilinea sp. LEGE 07088 TaxID=2777968 RepID=UPI00187F7001|nr:ABC transporter ATP-binding protein [Nodosilinea sp. LEGE 07088]MBE9138644.1 ABC transporter ATP-binding protein [Nodosilinea sp. LEGE 07088]
MSAINQTATDIGPQTARSHQGNITIQDLSIVFGSGRSSFVAIENISLDITSGEFICIIGPSGCGKSTVLNAIAGFTHPATGQVLVDGQPVQKPGGDRGMVFQQPSLFPWKTVLSNVAHGPLMAGRSKQAALAIARDFLQIVGLANFENNYPMTLSGGMQQRVAIARALANYPRVLLMDEPFGALDAQTRFMMQENLLRLWEEFRITVIFVTHDIDEALLLGDRVIVMSAGPGQVIEDIRVDFERPRDADLLMDTRFLILKKKCFSLIKKESLLAFEQQKKSSIQKAGKHN